MQCLGMFCWVAKEVADMVLHMALSCDLHLAIADWAFAAADGAVTPISHWNLQFCPHPGHYIIGSVKRNCRCNSRGNAVFIPARRPFSNLLGIRFSPPLPAHEEATMEYRQLLLNICFVSNRATLSIAT